MGTKISALPDASALDGSELVPVVQAAETRKTTTADIAALAPSSSDSFSGVAALSPGTATIGATGVASAGFTTPRYDTDGYWSGADSMSFTAPTSGFYRLTASVIWGDASGTSVSRDTHLTADTWGNVALVQNELVNTGAPLVQNLSGDCSLAAGEKVHCRLFNNGDATTYFAFMQVHRLGELPPPVLTYHSLLFGAGADGAGDLGSTLGTSDTTTFSCWLLLTALDVTDDSVVAWRGQNLGDWSVFLSVTNAGLLRVSCVMDVPSTTQYDLFGVTPLSLGTWHHCAFQVAGGVSMRLYLDGVSDATTTLAGTVFRTGGAGWKLGSDFAGAAVPPLGNIADPAWWNRQLTAGQVANLASVSIHPDALPTGLLSYYQILETSGTTLANQVSGGPTATLSGDVAIDPAVPPGF